MIKKKFNIFINTQKRQKKMMKGVCATNSYLVDKKVFLYENVYQLEVLGKLQDFYTIWWVYVRERYDDDNDDDWQWWTCVTCLYSV